MKNSRGVRVMKVAELSGVLLTALFLSDVDCRAEGATPELEAPVVSPAGPEITLNPGASQVIQANAAEATSYTWNLQGKGEISSSTGPAIIFIAPKDGGAAIISVAAHNAHGTSLPTIVAINTRAVVYSTLDALGIPAGWMSGGGNPSSYISLGTATAGCHSEPGCLLIRYRKGGSWGGMYWWPQNCGTSGSSATWSRIKADSCGINLLQVGFTAVSRLTFWVRGESGGEVVEFKVGGPDVAPRPGRSTGKRSLAPEWKQYEIDLNGADLTKAIGLFAWIAADLDNPHGAIFYLDDIQFEGVK